MEEIEARASSLLDQGIGDNLDHLVTLDIAGDGLVPALYRSAREVSAGPLALEAARALRKRVRTGAAVLVLTGFQVPDPETDGLPGSVVLTSALVHGLGARPVFVAEPAVLEAVRAGLEAVGLDSCRLVPFPGEVKPEQLADELGVVACVAVERAGPNPRGVHHFSGGARAEAVASIDPLYLAVQRRGALTVGVGDRGNELGLGAIVEAVRRELPAGASCSCGCGAGIACEIVADHTVIGASSDWGAYAVAAGLAHLAGDAGLLLSSDAHSRVVDAVVGAGAIDGPTRQAAPLIDGVDEPTNQHLLELLRAAVVLPNRASASRSRDRRARHQLNVGG